MQHKSALKRGKTSKPDAISSTQNNGGIEKSQLMKLFEDELKDIYWAEKALTKALSKMIKKATAEELSGALENHLQETLTHVERLENVFELIGTRAVGKKCEAMAGLIKESESIVKDSEKGPMRDAGIISAGQKIEHYEIASYGTLRSFATTLELPEVEALLGLTLNEEKAADDKLTEVAVGAINIQAAVVEDLEEVEGE